MSERPSATQLDLAAEVVATLRPLVEQLVEEAIERRLADLNAAQRWLTVEDYAAAMQTTVDAVRKRLERGRIAGAVKDGKHWLIPVEATATVSADQTTRGERRTNGPAPTSRR